MILFEADVFDDLSDPQFSEFIQDVDDFSKVHKEELALRPKDLVSEFIERVSGFSSIDDSVSVQVIDLIEKFKANQFRVRIFAGLRSKFVFEFQKEYGDREDFFSQIDAYFRRYFRLILNSAEHKLHMKSYKRQTGTKNKMFKDKSTRFDPGQAEFQYFDVHVNMLELFSIQKMLPSCYSIKINFEMKDVSREIELRKFVKNDLHNQQFQDLVNLSSCGKAPSMMRCVQVMTDWERKTFDQNNKGLKHPVATSDSKQEDKTDVASISSETKVDPAEEKKQRWEDWVKKQEVQTPISPERQKVLDKQAFDGVENQRLRDFKRKEREPWSGKETSWQKASDLDSLLTGGFLLNWDEKKGRKRK